MRTAIQLFYACIAITFVGLSTAAADDQSQRNQETRNQPECWIPASSSIFIAVEQPQLIIDVLSSAQLHDRLATIPQYQKSDTPEKLKQLGMVVGVIEGQLGLSWKEVARDLVTGVYLANDPANKATLVFVRGKNAELLAKLNQTVIDLTSADANRRNKESPVKSKEYNGVTGWAFGEKECHAFIGDWLVVSDKSDALREVIDREQDSKSKSLAENKAVANLRKSSSGALAWGGLRLDILREQPKFVDGLTPKNNPAAEFLFGGLFESLRNAPLLQFSMRADGDKLQASFAVERGESTRGWFFTQGDSLLSVPGLIGGISLARDVGGMWMDREKLFDEATNAKITQADSNLALFFSGRDFGPEILGQLGTSWQVLAAERKFTGEEPMPSIKLPAFALVIGLKEESFADTLVQAYQNIIGLNNLQAVQAGRPQLLLGSVEHQGVTLSKATHVVVPKADSEQGRFDYNFQPTCARVGKHFVLGSTVQIVRDAIDQLKARTTSKAGASSSINSSIQVQVAPLVAAFNANKELLVARHTLNTGKPREEARVDIDKLYEAAALLNRAAIELKTTDKELRLDITVEHGIK